MQALSVVALFGVIACASAGGLGVGLVGSVDGGAIISGPSGVIKRTGLASVGPIGAPGAIIAGVAPGAILAGGAPGLIGGGGVLVGDAGLGLRGGLGLGLGRGLGLGLGLGGIANPGLTAKVLGLEGSGIEGQYIPDINEKLYDDGSYKPQVYGH